MILCFYKIKKVLEIIMNYDILVTVITYEFNS